MCSFWVLGSSAAFDCLGALDIAAWIGPTQGGGGPFAVVAYNQVGRFDPSSPIVSGHSAAVLDFEWNPFHDEILASASDDSTIKVRFSVSCVSVLQGV